MRSWTGLSPMRFKKYRTLINREHPGVCGAYCCAVLAHDRVLHDTGISLDVHALVDVFRHIVDWKHPLLGSTGRDVARGLSIVFNETPIDVRYGYFPEYHVARLLQAGQGPVIVGTKDALGSRYGNHWLVVYRFRVTDDGSIEWMGYDNHGAYQSIVPAKETWEYVYLVNGEEN